MGGFGSGRTAGFGRDKVEHSRSIDVNRLHREGCLAPGWHGVWQWTRDGERIAWIGMRTEEANRLHLSYRIRDPGADWQDVEEPVQIVRVPCRYGGTRPYFICPGVVNGTICGRRVVKLQGAGRYFLCRHCYCLAYASQSESEWDRALRKAGKIRTRLGGKAGMDGLFARRPKGMWQRTYDRLVDAAVEAEDQANEAFEFHAALLLARLQWPKRSRGRSARNRSFWS